MMHTMRNTGIVGLMALVISAGMTTTTIAIAAVTEISGAGATFPYPVYAKWAEGNEKTDWSSGQWGMRRPIGRVSSGE